MMKREKFSIAEIYVPVKRRATLKPATVQELAQSMLEIGQQTPILVRRDGNRLVLKGKVMGALPMTARLTPEEARQGLKLLNFRLVLFLLTFLFRRG